MIKKIMFMSCCFILNQSCVYGSDKYGDIKEMHEYRNASLKTKTHSNIAATSSAVCPAIQAIVVATRHPKSVEEQAIEQAKCLVVPVLKRKPSIDGKSAFAALNLSKELRKFALKDYCVSSRHAQDDINVDYRWLELAHKNQARGISNYAWDRASVLYPQLQGIIKSACIKCPITELDLVNAIRRLHPDKMRENKEKAAAAFKEAERLEAENKKLAEELAMLEKGK